MNDTPSATIRRYLSSLTENPLADENTSVCVTIEGGGRDPFWIQLHRGMINFQHLDDSAKDRTLGGILDPLPVPDDADLDPGLFMTFTITNFSSDEFDQLLDSLVREYFGADGSEDLRLSNENL